MNSHESWPWNWLIRCGLCKDRDRLSPSNGLCAVSILQANVNCVISLHVHSYGSAVARSVWSAHFQRVNGTKEPEWSWVTGGHPETTCTGKIHWRFLFRRMVVRSLTPLSLMPRLVLKRRITQDECGQVYAWNKVALMQVWNISPFTWSGLKRPFLFDSPAVNIQAAMK